MRSVHLTTIFTLLTSLPALQALPSFIAARDAVGTDVDGATLEVCSISSSVNGEEGSMIMSSTVYKGDSSGEHLATLNTTFPAVFTTPGICWPSDDSNQPPFYLESGLMRYGVITNMCTPGSSGGGGFTYTYAGKTGIAAFEDQRQIESGIFQATNTAINYIFDCWVWDNPNK